MTSNEAVDDVFKRTYDFDMRIESRDLARRMARSGVKASFVQFAGEEHTSAAISALNRGIPFALRPEL